MKYFLKTKISRKQFLRSTTMGFVGTIVAGGVLAACSDDDDDDTDDRTGTGGDGTNGSGGSGGGAGGSGGGASGGGGAGGTGAPDACETDVELVNAHIHEVSVPPADVAAGEEMTYMLSDVAGHTHSITVTAADFAMLADGESVDIESSESEDHMHTVTVTCA